MNHFRHYLLGQKFLLRTAHCSIRWSFEFKDPRGQGARWLEELARYDFKIQHRPGSKHNDSPSRKDYKKNYCDHTFDGDENCPECKNRKEEWEEFHSEVDNVVELGVLVEKLAVKDGTTVKLYHLRALTRGQAKNVLETDKSQILLNGNKQTSLEVTPETLFIPSYKFKDTQVLQREDKDLGSSFLDR